MAERLKAPVLKTGDVKASVGSNPTLSAKWNIGWKIRHLRKYPSGRRGSPAKGVGCVKSAAEVQILSSAPRKARENIAFSLAFSFISSCFAKNSSILVFQKMPLPLSLPQTEFFTPKIEQKAAPPTVRSTEHFSCLFQGFIIVRLRPCCGVLHHQQELEEKPIRLTAKERGINPALVFVLTLRPYELAIEKELARHSTRCPALR